ncbi:Glutamine--fructose-6-phosphate aminotransferase [isomerizing] [Candidatus Burarchaeum australiense]|nr:Glutamine--fructose-6-phosphate aminotransferase [isomerizing] [Candidatus Burarchaeum australiense]
MNWRNGCSSCPMSSRNYEKREACGVVAAYSYKHKPVANAIYLALLAQQHRGQDGAGIAVVEGDSIELQKGMGLVTDAITREFVAGLNGWLGVGSVRYPTTGTPSAKDAQPFIVSDIRGGMANSHNGNLVNYHQMRALVQKEGRALSSKCDCEIIVDVFAEALRKNKGDFFKAAEYCMKTFDGAYCEGLVTGKGELFAFRDPHGIKPLCYGWNDELFMVASESVCLDINKIPMKGFVAPGSALLLKDGKLTLKQLVNARFATCMFEYVYFSRPDSNLDAGNVYQIRLKLGELLARDAPAKADVVVPMPDTARPAAEGYARKSGIPFLEGLIKNRYVGRTFIMPQQRDREAAVRVKFNPLRSLLKGKRVVLIDDSIVRGTTTSIIVRLLKEGGAKEVHVRITCPPIVGPCFYGIDMSTHKELIGANHSVEEIRKMLGADSLAYQTIGAMNEAIGLKADQMCNGCLHEDYPTPLAKKVNAILKGGSSEKRYWEEATMVH